MFTLMFQHYAIDSQCNCGIIYTAMVKISWLLPMKKGEGSSHLLMVKFDESGEIYFNDHENDPLCLRKKVWEKVIGKPEREYFQYNIDAIIDTIANPDQVRKSQQDSDSRVIYKKVESLIILPGIRAPKEGWYIAIVARGYNIVTMYPTKKIKEGEILWPPKKK